MKINHARIGKKFNIELKEIKAIRRLNIDKDLPREISNARLTDGMVDLPEWKTLRERLIREPKKEDLRLLKKEDLRLF